MTVFITIGLPGSGKTTMACDWVDADPTTRLRVNRDSIRRMMHPGVRYGVLPEEIVTQVCHTAITTACIAGMDVVVDDTNLNPEHRDQIKVLCSAFDAEVLHWDLTGIPVEECIRRDALRPVEHSGVGTRVGAEVIHTMAQRWGLEPPTETPS